MQPISEHVSTVIRGDTTGHLISLDFRDVIDNWETVFDGTTKQMGKTMEYMKGLMYDQDGNPLEDGLLNCTNIQQVFDLVDSADLGKAEGMRLKMKNYIRNIFH